MSAATVTPPKLSPRRPATFAQDACWPRLTTDQYDQMVRTGVLGPDDKMELLDNYVVLKIPKNEPHEGTVDLVREALTPHKPTGWMLRCQQTVVMPYNRPEPDFALVRGAARSFLTRHPSAADAALLVEVADTSRDRDLLDKAAIYAGARVPVYWVVNIPGRQVEVHTDPTGPVESAEYQTVTRYAAGQDVPLVLDGVTVAHIPAADLLP